MKDDGSSVSSEGKPSKRGAAASGAHEVCIYAEWGYILYSTLVLMLSSLFACRNKFGCRSHLQVLRNSP